MNCNTTHYRANSSSVPGDPTPAEGGYAHYAERIAGHVVRARSPSFQDHFTQARLFLDSQSPVERAHLADALSFELGKCERQEVRQRVVDVILAQIDPALAASVAKAIGVVPSAPKGKPRAKPAPPSPALSISEVREPSIRTRKVAILAAEGHVSKSLAATKATLEAGGASVEVVSTALGDIPGADGGSTRAVRSLLNTPSVAYDAVLVADGEGSASLLAGDADARRFVEEAHRHCKALAAIGHGQRVLEAAGVPVPGAGIVSGASAPAVAKAFVEAIGRHRHWAREKKRS